MALNRPRSGRVRVKPLRVGSDPGRKKRPVSNSEPDWLPVSTFLRLASASTRYWQVDSLTALGVVLNDKLTAADHVSSLLTSCSSSFYAMRVLHNHGLPATSLTDVFRATIIAKLTCCSSAWSGLTSAHDHARIDAFLRRSKRYGYCADSVPATRDH